MSLMRQIVLSGGFCDCGKVRKHKGNINHAVVTDKYLHIWKLEQ